MTEARARKRPRVVASHAAASRLAWAERWLAARPHDREVLVVAPTMVAAQSLCRRVHATDGAPRFGWHRFTPAALVARLSAGGLARRGLSPSTTTVQQALALRAVRQIPPADLGALTALVEAPGLPRAVAETATELRRHGVTLPADVFPSLRRVLDAMDTIRAEAAFADEVEMREEAIAALDTHPLRGADLLWIDPDFEGSIGLGFARAVLRASADGAMVVSAVDAETRRALEDDLGLAVEMLPEATAPAGLRRAQQHLFSRGTTTEEAEVESDGVAFFSSPGEGREAVEIARAIVDEAERGTPFEHMAVVLRSVETYREPLREAFRRAQIPAHFAGGTAVPDPAGRALLTLLACRRERLSAVRFAEYLSLGAMPKAEQAAPWRAPPGIFAPDEGAVEDASPAPQITPRLWERLIGEAAVMGGSVERWRRRLDGLAHTLLDDDDERMAASRNALDSLRAFALPLLERLAALPDEALWSTWLTELHALVEAGVAAGAHVHDALLGLAPLGPVGPVDLDEVRLTLEPRLSQMRRDREVDFAGRVAVVEPEAIRGRTYEVVFVPGLAERVFPPVVRQDPLLADDLRADIDPKLTRQEARIRRARLGLRLAVDAAERRLVASYPRLDDERSRPRVPSFYALELVRAAEGVLPRYEALARRHLHVTAARLGWPAPERAEAAIDEAEFDLAVLGRLLAGAPDRAGAAAYLLAANPHLARALRTRQRRWLPKWTRADGLTRSEQSEPPLRARDPRHHPISPTALEPFAACPYRFYLRAVVGLTRADRVSDEDDLDARRRGILIHRVQQRIVREVVTDELDPEAALARLDDVIETTSAELLDALCPPIPRVFHATVEQVREDLRGWLWRLLQDPDGWRPRFAELGFGLQNRDGALDPHSRPEPITVEGFVLLGAIDLVEQRTRADGALEWRATDHKTGVVDPRLSPGFTVDGGRRLQPLLYALALETVAAEADTSVVSGRLYHATRRGRYASLEVGLTGASRATGRRVLQLVARSFDEGYFPAAPERGACEHCDYRVVCGPYEEQRTARKGEPPLLRELRRLP